MLSGTCRMNGITTTPCMRDMIPSTPIYTNSPFWMDMWIRVCKWPLTGAQDRGCVFFVLQMQTSTYICGLCKKHESKKGRVLLSIIHANELMTSICRVKSTSETALQRFYPAWNIMLRYEDPSWKTKLILSYWSIVFQLLRKGLSSSHLKNVRIALCPYILKQVCRVWKCNAILTSENQVHVLWFLGQWSRCINLLRGHARIFSKPLPSSLPHLMPSLKCTTVFTSRCILFQLSTSADLKT